MKTTLFINCSPNHSGNTVSDARQYLRSIEYDTLHLSDYHIDQYGVVGEQDQIGEVFSQISQYDSLVIGTPVYWYTVSGILKTFMDRWYLLPEAECLAGKNLYFFIQGAAPDEHCRATVTHLITRACSLTGMNLKGLAVGLDELLVLPRPE